MLWTDYSVTVPEVVDDHARSVFRIYPYICKHLPGSWFYGSAAAEGATASAASDCVLFVVVRSLAAAQLFWKVGKREEEIQSQRMSVGRPLESTTLLLPYLAMSSVLHCHRLSLVPFSNYCCASIGARSMWE